MSFHDNYTDTDANKSLDKMLIPACRKQTTTCLEDCMLKQHKNSMIWTWISLNMASYPFHNGFLQLCKQVLMNSSIRIFNGCSVLIENSITRVTVRHHEARREMPNSYPCDRLFNSFSCILFLWQLYWRLNMFFFFFFFFVQFYSK